LGFSPLLDETNQTSENHMNFLSFVLEIFQKDFSNVICLVGDNCSTNLALANLCNKPLIGCAAHRFNLAIQKHLKESHELLLSKVNDLMTKLRTLNIAGKLRTLTPLRPQLRCATRWTGTFSMLSRFFELQPFINELAEDEVEIEGRLLSQRELREASTLNEELKLLSSVMTKLQDPSLTLLQARMLFDGTLSKFPQMHAHLSADSKIIHSPYFESGIVKLLQHRHHLLTEPEIASLSCLEINGNDEDEIAMRPKTNHLLT